MKWKMRVRRTSCPRCLSGQAAHEVTDAGAKREPPPTPQGSPARLDPQSRARHPPAPALAQAGLQYVPVEHQHVVYPRRGEVQDAESGAPASVENAQDLLPPAEAVLGATMEFDRHLA